jgi:hypothetical protein
LGDLPDRSSNLDRVRYYLSPLDRYMSETPLFQGQILYSRLNPYARFLLPLVEVQKIYKTFYYWLLRLLWDELIYNKKVENQWASLGLFLFFWVFCLGLYHLRNYLGILLFFSFGLWYVDYAAAKKHYLEGKDRTPTTLQLDREGRITWSTRVDRHRILKSEFIAGQVAAIVVDRKVVYGGAFQEKLGKIWQVQLRFWDGSDLVLHEQSDLVLTLQQAKILGEYFSVQIIFLRSQGYGEYCEESLEEKATAEFSSLQVQQKKGKVHLMTRWRWRNTRSLLERVFQDSGFSLFVVLMTNLMANLGQFLDTIITAFTRSGEETILYLPDIFRGVTHDFQPLYFINLVLATGWMIYRGWRFSRAKYITIDKYELKYAIHHRRIDRLKTASIESVLLLQEPDLALLIIGQEKAIILEEFQQIADCQELITGIEWAIDRFPPSR